MTTAAQIAIQRVQRAQAILDRAVQNLDRVLSVEDRLEEALVNVAQRVGRPIFKPLRLEQRAERILRPVRTSTIFTRVIGPIIRILGLNTIFGSATFTVEELEVANLHVFFNTERGFIAGMERIPYAGTFYKPITREERLNLEELLPDTHLIARLFTPPEDPENE